MMSSPHRYGFESFYKSSEGRGKFVPSSRAQGKAVFQGSGLVKSVEANLFLSANEKFFCEFRRHSVGICPETTHLVVDDDSIKRTEKLLSAIAANVWIVPASYVFKCLDAGKLLPAEGYDLGNSSTVNPFIPSPGTRRNWKANGGVFRNWEVVFIMKDQILKKKYSRVIQAGSGTVRAWTLLNVVDLMKKDSLTELTHIFSDCSFLDDFNFKTLRRFNYKRSKPVPILSHVYLEEFLTSPNPLNPRAFSLSSPRIRKLHRDHEYVELQRLPHNRSLNGSPKLSMSPRQVQQYLGLKPVCALPCDTPESFRPDSSPSVLEMYPSSPSLPSTPNDVYPGSNLVIHPLVEGITSPPFEPLSPCSNQSPLPSLPKPRHPQNTTEKSPEIRHRFREDQTRSRIPPSHLSEFDKLVFSSVMGAGNNYSKETFIPTETVRVPSVSEIKETTAWLLAHKEAFETEEMKNSEAFSRPKTDREAVNDLIGEPGSQARLRRKEKRLIESSSCDEEHDQPVWHSVGGRRKRKAEEQNDRMGLKGVDLRARKYVRFPPKPKKYFLTVTLESSSDDDSVEELDDRLIVVE